MKKCRLLLAFLCLGFAFEMFGSEDGLTVRQRMELVKQREKEAQAKAAAAPAKPKRSGGGRKIVKSAVETKGGGAAADDVNRLKKLSDEALNALEEIYSQTESYKKMFKEVELVLSKGGNVAEALACARKQEAHIVLEIRDLINQKRSDLLLFSTDFNADNIIGLSVKAVGQLVARMFWKVGENLVARNVYFDLEPVRAVMQAMNVASAEIAEIKPVAQAEGFTVQVVDGQTVYQFPKIQKLKDLKAAVKRDIPGIDLFTLTYFGKGEYYGAVVENNKIFQSCLQNGGVFSLARLYKVAVIDDATKASKNFKVKDVYDLIRQFNRGNSEAWEARLIGFFFKSLEYSLYIMDGTSKIKLNDYSQINKYSLDRMNQLLLTREVFVAWGQEALFEILNRQAAPANLGGGAPAAPIQQVPAPVVAPAVAQPVQQPPAAPVAQPVSVAQQVPLAAAPAVARLGNPADDLQRLHQMLNELNQQAQAL